MSKQVQGSGALATITRGPVGSGESGWASEKWWVWSQRYLLWEEQERRMEVTSRHGGQGVGGRLKWAE